MRLLFLALLLVPVLANAETTTFDLSPVKKWLTVQKSLRSASADFVQTRALKTLRSPLAIPGKLWFSAPNAFRWEIGQPAKMIVLSSPDGIYIIHPTKKKAEKLPPGAMSREAGQQGLGMMNFPFKGTFEDFIGQFDVLDVSTNGPECHLKVLPKNAQARKFLASISFAFNTDTGALIALEIMTKEGSSIRNEFSNTQLNGPIDRSLFVYDLTGYKVVDAQE